MANRSPLKETARFACVSTEVSYVMSRNVRYHKMAAGILIKLIDLRVVQKLFAVNNYYNLNFH